MTVGWRACMALCALMLAFTAQALDLERIEPPNWWVGMKDPRLQLLVHGPGIGAASVSSGHAALRITGVQRVASPNYLFIDARVAPGTRAVSVPLRTKSPTPQDTKLMAKSPKRTPAGLDLAIFRIS